MVQKIRDMTITIEMVLFKIMVAIVIKIQHKETGEMEDKSRASNVGDGDI